MDRHATTAEPLGPLLAELRGCRHCAARFAATATAHAPNPIVRASRTARMGVVGQAPGLRAHAAATPFADPSGVRLRAWMGVDEAAFYDEARFAMLPMGFCFPGYDARGSDLPPPRDCAPLWRPRLFAALPALETLLLIGRAALAWHLPAARGRKLAEIVRDGATQDADGRIVIPLPHPSWRNNAWLKANPWFETETLPVLRATVADALLPP